MGGDDVSRLIRLVFQAYKDPSVTSVPQEVAAATNSVTAAEKSLTQAIRERASAAGATAQPHIEANKREVAAVRETAAAYDTLNKQRGGGGGGGGQRGVIGEIGMDIGKVAMWGVATAAVYGTIQALRSGIETYAEFEMETVKLGWAGKNIAEGFATQHDAAIALTEKILTLKNAYGSVGVEAMQAADVFARLGETQPEIERDTEVAVKLGRVGGMPAQEVARLGEAMRLEFGLSAEEFQKVADKLALIGFSSPATIKGLLEGGTRVGAVWKQAGGHIEEVFAIIAAGRMGGRPEPEIANAVRTMMVRLENPTHQQALYDLTRKATGKGMDVVGPTGEIKPPWEIFAELKSIFTKLSETGRSDLAGQLGFTVGSTRGANILQSIMTNFGVAEEKKKMMEEGSSGALNIKAAESLNTFKGNVDKASAALESLWARASGPGGWATGVAKAAADTLEGGNRMLGGEFAKDIFNSVGGGFLNSGMFSGGKQTPGAFSAFSAGMSPGTQINTPPDLLEDVYAQHARQFTGEFVEPDFAKQLRENFSAGENISVGAKVAEITAQLKELSNVKGGVEATTTALQKFYAIMKDLPTGPIKDRIEALVKANDEEQKLVDKQTRAEERSYSIHLRGTEMVSKAKSEYEAELEGGKKGPHREELAALKEQKDLQNELARLKGTDVDALSQGAYNAQQSDELRVQEALENSVWNIQRAQWNDKKRMVEEQTRENDALQKKLGMLSDEDMLKARIMAGQMKRGEIGKSMDVGEWSLLGSGVRRMYGMLGGQVTGQFGGMGFGGEGGMGGGRGLSAAESGGNVAPSDTIPGRHGDIGTHRSQGFYDSQGRWRGTDWNAIPTYKGGHGESGAEGERGEPGRLERTPGMHVVQGMTKVNGRWRPVDDSGHPTFDSRGHQTGTEPNPTQSYPDWLKETGQKRSTSSLLSWKSSPAHEPEQAGSSRSQPPRPPAPRYASGGTGGNVSQDPMAVSNAHVFAVAIVKEMSTLLKLPLPVVMQSTPSSGTARNAR